MDMGAKSGIDIYTLGHSRHSIQAFIALLHQHGIQRVVDVRGQPYSRRNPQFNRERLAICLSVERIDYTWSGEHLSGRPRGARFYGPRGEVPWSELMAEPKLQAALDTLVTDARCRRLALVCAEEDPVRCHRRFLLTPPLSRRGIEVLHIRGDGRIEPESALIETEAGAKESGQQDLFK